MLFFSSCGLGRASICSSAPISQVRELTVSWSKDLLKDMQPKIVHLDLFLSKSVHLITSLALGQRSELWCYWPATGFQGRKSGTDGFLGILLELWAEDRGGTSPWFVLQSDKEPGQTTSWVHFGVFRWAVSDREIAVWTRPRHLHAQAELCLLGPWRFSLHDKERKGCQAAFSVSHLIQMAPHTPVLAPVLFSPLRIKKNSP